MRFNGISVAQFEAYIAPRASSNAFNRPRLEVREKAMALGRVMLGEAAASGLALELRASDDHPSLWNKRSVTAQWVFLWRDAAARRELDALLVGQQPLRETLADPTPFFRHAFLALHVDADGLEVSLRIHGDAWVDARNLRARCDADASREALVAVLAALPEDFVLGVTDGPRVPVRDVDAGALATALQGWSQPEQWWSVGWPVPKAAVLDQGEALEEPILQAFRALLPVYRLVAWSRENDLLGLDRELAQAAVDRAAAARESEAREAAWQASQAAEIERRRAETAAEARDRAVVHPRRAAAAVKGAARTERAPAEKAPAPTAAPARVVTAPKPAPAPKPAAPAAPAVLSVGVRVRVKGGPFEGKVGAIVERDVRGAKVSFGLLSARVDAADLEAI